MSAVIPQHPVNLELRDGAIILTVNDNYAIFTPDQAMEFSEQMARYAHESKTGMVIKSKSVIAERIRGKLLNRVSLVLKSLIDKEKKPLYIANEIVDIILSEAL